MKTQVKLTNINYEYFGGIKMGKTFKRVMGLALATLMVVGVLAGCSKNGEQKANASDWDYIDQKGELVIGMTHFSPMNYKDDNGELTGFETEFAKAVCERLGVKANFIEIEWASKETELNSKNIDCIWNGMTIDEDRKANMNISNPYMTNKQVLIVKKGNEGKFGTPDGIKGATVVAEKGSAGEKVAQGEDFFKEAKYTAVDVQSKVLLELKAGTADVGLIDYVMATDSIGEGTDFADLTMVPGTSFADEQYGIGFRKGSTATTTKVNETIAQLMADGTLDKIADKYDLKELLVKQQ